MDSYNELLIDAIAQNDLNGIIYCIRKGANANKICSSGITPLGAAAQTGNIVILKLLAESTKNNIKLDIENKNCSKPLYLPLNLQNTSRRQNNIGYFVVCKDVDDNELGDGPTPDGMDALEWDMEISDEDENIIDENTKNSPEISIYKWYAKILNQTSLALKSPEYDISRLDTHGQNVLHYAVRYGSKEMIDYILSTYSEIHVNVVDSGFNTPLHMACMVNNLEVIECLITKGADVNGLNAIRETPLHIASQRGHLDVVKLLIDRGAKVNSFDMDERSPLSMAINKSHESIAAYLITKGTRLNHEEVLGYTALYNAVWNNIFSITKCLLDNGAKIYQSHYLLHMATRHDNFDIVQLLHRAGASINTRDEQGNTPLMFACMQKNLKIAKYLLENGARTNTPNHINGMTALHLCIQDNETDVNILHNFVDLLLAYDADLNATSFHGNAIFYSIILGNINAATILIKYGADVDRKDDEAYFDNLSLAKRTGNFELTKMIIYAGFKLKNMSVDIRSLKNTGDDPIYDFIFHCKTRPLNLRDLCRIKIRNYLDKNIIKKISRLPLPPMIQNYLTLDIL